MYELFAPFISGGIGGGLAGIAVVAFLGKTLMNNLINRDLEKFKLDLRKEIEAYRAHIEVLKAKSTLSIEDEHHALKALWDSVYNLKKACGDKEHMLTNASTIDSELSNIESLRDKNGWLYSDTTISAINEVLSVSIEDSSGRANMAQYIEDLQRKLKESKGKFL